jgi:hypothetical protein
VWSLKPASFAAFIAVILIAFTALAQVDVTQAFYPSGTMGDWGDISLDEASVESPYSGPDCIKITYSAAQSQGTGYVGICWQYPDSNTGSEPGRSDLVGSGRVSLWAKGELGGEVAEFSAGGGPMDSLSRVSTGPITLSNQWQQYSLDLSGKDLSSVASGFCVTMTKGQNPTGATIYLDDIIYE